MPRDLAHSLPLQNRFANAQQIRRLVLLKSRKRVARPTPSRPSSTSPATIVLNPLPCFLPRGGIVLCAERPRGVCLQSPAASLLVVLQDVHERFVLNRCRTRTQSEFLSIYFIGTEMKILTNTVNHVVS